MNCHEVTDFVPSKIINCEYGPLHCASFFITQGKSRSRNYFKAGGGGSRVKMKGVQPKMHESTKSAKKGGRGVRISPPPPPPLVSPCKALTLK